MDEVIIFGLIKATTTTAPSCNDGGCGLNKAKDNNLVHNKVWTYDGQHYKEKGVDSVLQPWEGFWVATLGDSSGYDLLLTASAGGSDYHPLTDMVHPGILFKQEDINNARVNIVGTQKWNKFKESWLHKITPGWGLHSTPITCDSNNEGDKKACEQVTAVSRSMGARTLKAIGEKDIDSMEYAFERVNEFYTSWVVGKEEKLMIKGSNSPLMSVWTLYEIAKDIELIVSNDFGYELDEKKLNICEKVLDKIYKQSASNPQSGKIDFTGPRIQMSSFGGNWVSAGYASNLAYWVAKHAIAMKRNDKKQQQDALAGFNFIGKKLHNFMKSMIYMNKDGDYPLAPEPIGNIKPISDKKRITGEYYVWRLPYASSSFTRDGMISEYYRDLPHANMGLSYLVSAIEIVYIQGAQDLYTLEKDRLIAGIETINGAYLHQSSNGNEGVIYEPYGIIPAIKNEPTTGTVWPLDFKGLKSCRSFNCPIEKFYWVNATYHNVPLRKVAKERGWDMPYTKRFYDQAPYQNEPEYNINGPQLFDEFFFGYRD